MAIPIQDGGLIATRLQALLGLQGRVAPSLEEFILPTVQVADLSLSGLPPVSRSASAAFRQAAVVGEKFTMTLECPASCVMHIRKLNMEAVISTVSLTAHFGSSVAVAPANVADHAFTDTRLAAEEPAGNLTFDTQAALLATFEWRQRILAGINTTILPNNWFVGARPRSGDFAFIELQATTDNVLLQGSVEWDEYQLF